MGAGPGLMAGVEAAAALRALASDQLAQIADGEGAGPTVDAAEARLIEIRERYKVRRALLSLQGDRAARTRRSGAERGLGNASARLLTRS